MSDPVVGPGKVVKFTYFIVDEDGSQVERSDLPLQYVHGGRSTLLPKLEQTLEGCAPGAQVKVRVTPEEGFGPHRPELTFTDDIDNVPPQFRQLGAEVEMQSERGEVKQFVVSKLEGGKLTVDGNHPLAGKNLELTVNVLDVRDATPEEAASGEAQGGQFAAMSFPSNR